MARPAKSMRVKSGAISSEAAAVRRSVEDKVRGAAALPEPPEGLTKEQREIFSFIVHKLVDSGILGELDVFVLESVSVAVDRIRRINALIDSDHSLLSDTALQNARAKYQSDLWRGCNELCLSPQARAKIGSLAAQAVKEREDPLLEALKDDDYTKT